MSYGVLVATIKKFTKDPYFFHDVYPYFRLSATLLNWFADPNPQRYGPSGRRRCGFAGYSPNILSRTFPKSINTRSIR
jgi:hypothetical protein